MSALSRAPRARGSWFWDLDKDAPGPESALSLAGRVSEVVTRHGLLVPVALGGDWTWEILPGAAEEQIHPSRAVEAAMSMLRVLRQTGLATGEAGTEACTRAAGETPAVVGVCCECPGTPGQRRRFDPARLVGEELSGLPLEITRLLARAEAALGLSDG
ncbi:hypothetical protein [Streptomyces sp. NPDC048202]|uniref:hypothetical protein n=1 Tax=Streptomyces sp. NPDC048202 TaxID=3365514 RepID=UPI003720E6B1